MSVSFRSLLDTNHAFSRAAGFGRAPPNSLVQRIQAALRERPAGVQGAEGVHRWEHELLGRPVVARARAADADRQARKLRVHADASGRQGTVAFQEPFVVPNGENETS